MQIRLLTVLALALVLGACGRDVVVGGYRGEVRTVATSGEDGGASASRSVTSSSAAEAAAASTAKGSIELSAAAALLDENGREHALTDGFASGRFRIEGADSVLLGDGSVPAGRYRRVRIRFARVSAEVSGGVVIGGIALTGPVLVGIAGEPLVVEAPLDLLVEAGTTRTLVVDLNADAWLSTADPIARVVQPSAFSAALRVRSR